MQDATNAAAALDAMTRSKTKANRRSNKKPRSGGAATTPKPPLPKPFEAETPFMWETINVFDSPAPDNEAWLWEAESAPAETKNEAEEVDSKTPERTVGAEMEEGADEADGNRSNDDEDPEGTSDREFLKDDVETESEDGCPATEEDEFIANSDEDYDPHDGVTAAIPCRRTSLRRGKN